MFRRILSSLPMASYRLMSMTCWVHWHLAFILLFKAGTRCPIAIIYSDNQFSLYDVHVLAYQGNDLRLLGGEGKK
jgi:hypothetical protein